MSTLPVRSPLPKRVASMRSRRPETQLGGSRRSPGRYGVEGDDGAPGWGAS